MPPAFPAERIAKLPPRLASLHEGKVIATVRAIGRTLSAAGCDWHDLVTRLQSSPQRPFPLPSERTQGRWRRLDDDQRIEVLKRLVGFPELFPWELGFVASIHGMLDENPEVWLSARQIAVLDRLFKLLEDAEATA